VSGVNREMLLLWKNKLILAVNRMWNQSYFVIINHWQHAYFQSVLYLTPLICVIPFEGLHFVLSAGETDPASCWQN